MGIDAKPRIEADWKISKVLAEYPDVLDAIVSCSPAFEKLRNPLIRRVQSKLVTVEQAAGVAGIDVTSMLARLNVAAGFDDVVEENAPAPASSPGAAAEVPPWVPDAKISEELDVRPLIARGEEPFSMITGAARRVPLDGVLKLRSPFDPVPLHDALAKQGFVHYTTGSGEDWVTLYCRMHEAGSGKSAKPVTTTSEKQTSGPVTAEVRIDVSELVPPEPLLKILAALEELPDGGQLTVHHVRRPMHLYPRLDELGYAYETTELGPDHIQLIIVKTVSA